METPLCGPVIPMDNQATFAVRVGLFSPPVIASSLREVAKTPKQTITPKNNDLTRTSITLNLISHSQTISFFLLFARKNTQAKFEANI
jgi:hypothetical protein